jgi:NTE family protein
LSNNRKKIGLVIGSGGVKCAAAIGLMSILVEEGIAVDMVVGCSGGSLYTGTIALGYTLEEIIEATSNIWTPNIMKDYASNLSAFQSGQKRFTNLSGLVDDGPLNEALVSVFGGKTFDDLRMPHFVVTTDFNTGQTVVIDSGSLMDAIRASVAIPTIFPPWEVDGRLLIDGAASDPLPVDIAIQQGADIIIAMGFELDYRPRIRSLTAANTHLTSIYTNNLLRASFAFHTIAHHHEIIPIIPEFENRVSMSDTHLIPEIIEKGKQAARQEVDYLKRLLETTS